MKTPRSPILLVVLACTILVPLNQVSVSLAQIGTVVSHQKISEEDGGFSGLLTTGAGLGASCAPLGDFDGDGVADLVAGSPGDTEAGTQTGSIWLLFLNGDGTVKNHQKINALHGNFTGGLDLADGFGTGVSALGDLDGDGVTDIAVGAFYDDDGGFNKGAVWIFSSILTVPSNRTRR